MRLFQRVDFTGHSGSHLSWKVECDALSSLDWDALAFIYSQRQYRFGKVVGVPRGGLHFAEALKYYADPSSDTALIADDVLTTGASMEEMYAKVGGPAIGVVAFARAKPPAWIDAIWVLAA